MEKKTGFIFLLAALLCFNADAQLLKRLKDKAAQATESAIGNKITRKVDKAVNGDEIPKAEQPPEEKPSVTGAQSAPLNVKSVSRYDFVPGNTVLYQEDFSQDAIGELPLKWYTQSMGEVVTLDGKEGQWLRMIPDGMYLSPLFSMKDNFTIEFDLVGKLPQTGWLPASFQFSLYDNGAGKAVFGYDFRMNNMITFNISPRARLSNAGMMTFEKGSRKFNNDLTKIPGYIEKSSNVVHVAINVQKERIRVWLDEEKVYDVPDAAPLNAVFNQMKFGMGSTNYSKDQTGFYVSNIKLAAGAADTRSKLITEGKLVTTGIVFAVNSDEITPNSIPVIKEIAAALKEAPEMKIRITGHTDSDGDDAANLELSKKRAAAVKKMLHEQFEIAEGRMQTDGKGESMPAGKNDTAEGKANNRRVEFTKQQ